MQREIIYGHKFPYTSCLILHTLKNRKCTLFNTSK
ncbi:hypothetical protein LINPERPRIM_LOCUS21458 [Linum perenne]